MFHCRTILYREVINIQESSTLKRKYWKAFSFLGLACVAFDLPEQLLLCRYEECTLTKGNVSPWIFTDCKFSSAQAKPRWQKVRPSMRFLCCSVQHVRNANQHLKGNVGFQRRHTKMHNGNIYSPTKNLVELVSHLESNNCHFYPHSHF